MKQDSDSEQTEILERLREALEQTKALRESARGVLDTAKAHLDPADARIGKTIFRAERLFEELSTIFQKAIAAYCSR